MRTLEATRQRWDVLFSAEKIGLNLRQVVIDLESEPNPCEEGLRSVCWKTFLLYGPLSQTSWSKKLSDSRNAYTSLREHFLRYIDHPDDLQSTVDPLADDASSPWSTLRQDEMSRGEIFQDVERCMQDNSFFHEPSTQKMLLDILFVYSKLHPDTGYRQGMHELLAPILWVVECDAVKSMPPDSIEAEDALMLNVLDRRFVEHDAFTLFCAVMQTAKSFYEIGDSASSIVDRSRRILDDDLGEVDPELAKHLQSIEILPQIFLLRWIRLLFGREFGLKDTLLVWDVLFAENLRPSIVDMTCLAMLLRLHWQLLQAHHTAALQLLLHYEPPVPPDGPATLVRDAMLLERNRTFDTGANLIARYSGRRPTLLTEQRLPTPRRPPALQLSQRSRNNLSPAVGSSHSPGRSPARFLSPQKGLETLFQEVSGTLQKRTEGWKVPKAVREVVGEVRRNMNSNFQSGTASPRKSLDAPHSPRSQQSAGQETMAILRRRLSTIETRNRALAKMLGDAIEELRTQKQTPEERRANMAEESFNMALAKMQFVQVYLSDTDIPLPGENGLPIGDSPEGQSKEAEQVDTHQAISRTSSDELTAGNQREVAVADKPPTSPRTLGLVYESRPRTVTTGAGLATQDEKGHTTSVKQFSKSSPQARPPLAQSPLSWMLGEGHHRSEFVSSSTAPPEQRRESTSIPKPKSKRLFADGKTTEGRDDSDTEDDGFTLSSLHGSQSQN